jgi:NAD(P)-dependent dehydrogenase (short-subunit alcohol dehydrogenase family)
MDLNGTVVVVTGASGGLGGGIARAFAAAGAAVVVHYRSSTELAAEVVGDIIDGGGRAISAQCDITDPEGCTRLMATAVEAFGRLTRGPGPRLAGRHRTIPTGGAARAARPADVGNACVFLASPMAEWITGHDLVVDGGVSAHPTW